MQNTLSEKCILLSILCVVLMYFLMESRSKKDTLCKPPALSIEYGPGWAPGPVQSGRFEKENISFPLLGIEPQPVRLTA